MSRIDPERIGSLLDGLLGPPAREALLGELAVADDLDYDTFAETAAVLAELRGETEPSAAVDPAPQPVSAAAGDVAAPPATSPRDRKVVPLRPRAPRWRTPALAGALALAALVAAMALVPALRPWGRAARPLDDPADAVALLSSPASGVPVLGGERPWSGIYRGEAPLSPNGRAVRLGAYLVDLQLAATARDPRLAGLADTVASLVSEVPGGGAAAALYRNLPEPASADLGAPLAAGYGAVRQLVPADALELGVWTETARIAAARHDAAFFASHKARAALSRIDGMRWLPPEVRDSARAVTAATHAGPEWPRIGQALDEMVRSSAR